MQALTEALPTGGGHSGCCSESSPPLSSRINALSLCPSPVLRTLPELKSLPFIAAAQAWQRAAWGFKKCRGKFSPPSLSVKFSLRLTPFPRPPGQQAVIQETTNIWALLSSNVGLRAALTTHASQDALQLAASHLCSGFRWACSPPALSMHSKLHALNISQKFKVTEPEVLQSGTLNFRKLVRIVECACSLFNCSTSFSYMLLSTAVQDTY